MISVKRKIDLTGVRNDRLNSVGGHVRKIKEDMYQF